MPEYRYRKGKYHLKRKVRQILSCILSSALLSGMIPAVGMTAFAEQTEPAQDEIIIRDANGVLPMTEEDVQDIQLVGSMDDYEYYTAKIEGAKPSAAAYSLPSKYDNSTNENAIYMPPVGDQGAIGSCVAWATVYYQYTYTMNKARGVPTTTANTYSPNFAYNLVNCSSDNGTWCYSVYDLLKKQGVPTIQDVPLVKTNPPISNYLNWYATDGIWERALDNRILDYTFYYSGESSDQFFAGQGSYIASGEAAIKSPDDQRLDIIKKALSDGKLLVFDSNIGAWKESVKIKSCNGSSAVQNPNHYSIDNNYVGEYVTTQQAYAGGRQTGHEMTIVGYNDEIWTDINNNNVVDEGEMGAFKMVNSWDDKYPWYLSSTFKIDNNKGFLWIAYDALNHYSAVSGVSQEYRECLLHAVASISVDPQQSNANGYNLTYSLKGKNRDACPVTVTAVNKTTGEEFSGNAVPLDYPYYSQTGHVPYSYAGVLGAEAEAIMTIDLEKIVPDIAAYGLEGFDWSVRIGNGVGGETMTVRDMRIKDKKNGKEYAMNAVPGFSFTETGKTVTIPITDNPAPLNRITIYYKGYSTPYIHYQIETGAWTDVPGKAMTSTNEVSGYTHKYVIDLGTKSYANVCFNDGRNNWDSRNGANYRFTSGTFTYQNGNIAVYTPPAPQALTADVSLSSNIVPINQTVTISASAQGGTAPYQYQYSFVKNGTESLIKSYSSQTSIGFTPTAAVTYVIKATVKDAAGKTASKTIGLTAATVSINSLTTDKATAKAGENITLKTSVLTSGVPVSCSYVISGNGSSKTIAANSDYSAVWKPDKEGVYTITSNVLFNGAVIASKSISYTVEKGADIVLNEVTIYYKGYATPYIHYQVASGAWTAVPGKAMLKTSEVSGYTHKYTISLGSADYANVCFNDGNNHWDSRNGANYVFTKGVYTFSNGNISVYTPPVPKELTASVSVSAQKVPTNEMVTVSGSASGGTAPYQYQYSYILDGTETVFKSYTSANSASFRTTAPGTYYVKVSVKDAVGSVAEKTVPVSAVTVSIDSITADKSVLKTGETVRFKANVTTGGIPVIYEYQVTDNNTTKNLSINTDNTASWTPDKTGTYTVIANLRYNGTVIVTKTQSFTVEKGADVTVNSLTIYYKGYSRPYIHYQVGSGAWTAVPGKAMTATGEKSGYTHKYTINLGTAGYANVCFNDGNNNWDSRNGANYRFEKGTYTYQNGTMNKIAENGSQTTAYALLTNTSVLSKTTLTVGESFKVRASASGGTAPYTYAVYYKKASSSSWTTKQTYKSNAVAVITPSVASAYDVCVKVKDASGLVAKQYFTVRVLGVLKTNATMSADTVTLGSSVKLKAAASGGTGSYTYGFYYKKASQSSWKTVQSYDTKAYVSIKPAVAAAYEVCIKVKDSNGTIAKTYYTLTVK